MTITTICPVTTAETRPIRHAVLRPHQSLARLAFPGDDAPDTLHIGIFLNNQLVGITSIACKQFPNEQTSTHGDCAA